MKINGTIFKYFQNCEKDGRKFIVLKGGRRSGKTFAILQKMLIDCNNENLICNVASMTSEQGRLGAYADAATIIKSEDYFSQVYNVWKSPREVRHCLNGSRIFFNSYADGERAKGIACDYLFVNEANNFTEQQFVDLLANVRMAVFIDFNPNKRFWVEKYVNEDEILTTTWKDNRSNLTETQLAYFAKLKELGDRPDASPIDRRNYEVYYLGKYSEAIGKVFSPSDFAKIDVLPSDCRNFAIFCDPSALRGADWFPVVLSAWSESLGKVVVVEVSSTNIGSRELRAKDIRDICCKYDGVQVYVETNGIIGQEFYEYCINSGLPVIPWYSRGNKFERICSQYEDLTQNSVYLASDQLSAYLEQVYDFEQKCEHDDNVDALASSAMLQHFLR